MDLGRYLKIGLRWWWLILLSVALSATASYLYSERLPRIYAAKATLMVGNNIIEDPNPDVRNLGTIRTLAEVYSELARRKTVTQAVIDKLGLDMSPDQLSDMIQTTVIPTAQLLEIFVLDVHPQRAQLLANTIAEELIFQSPTGAGGQQEREKFIQVQLEDLQARIEEIDGRIKALEDSLPDLTSAVEIAEAQSQLDELETLKSDYQNRYTQFLSNLSESSINRLAIFERAAEPTWPVSPNVKKNVAIAAAAGLVLAVSAIVLLEFLNDSLVWRREGSQSILGLPVLGAVNKVANSDSKIVVHDTLWSPEADSLRNVRNSISLAASERTLSSLLVTSASQGEGKSFLAANLAVAAASAGSSMGEIIALPGASVILIDADLRQPSLHEIFDMPNLLGLADVLAMPEAVAEKMLEKALKPTHIDSLLLLPAGRAPLDPGSLLNSPRFANVLRSLGTQADLVIIDSAPVLEAIETKAMANVVDGVVMVVSDGQSRGRVVQKVIDYFQSRPDHDNLLGIVFNRVKLPASYAYYAYAYKPQQLEKSKRQPSLLDKIWPFAQTQQTGTTSLTLAEAANHLGVSQDTTRRWCEQGRILAVKKGRRWSVRLEDLNEFIAGYQGDGTGENMMLPQETVAVDKLKSNGANGSD